MTLNRNLLKYTIAALILLTVAANKTYADGFPVRPGRFILSPSVSYFFANKQWDSVSHKKSFDDNGRFHSLNYAFYGEYGISRKFTVSALLPYTINSFKNDSGKFSSSGLQDIEIGLKYYLANINYKYYFSIKATGIIPTYKNNPSLGYSQYGTELKLAFAGSGHLFGRNSYFVAENGVREYFGYESVFQDRYNLTYGLTLDKNFHEQVSLSVGGFYSTSSSKAFNNDPLISANPSTNKNFAFNQVSLSYGHAFAKNLSLFLTGGRFITGRNTAVGTSVSASLNYRIDTK
ncbi:hypothetical protein SAMN05216464_12222 [Mucilaginibacter pineti]|uniref:MetA-pathway of phenol degradation n=1 Tax=Mucilaginibacter pineti TaxID=1391627 RepID=A0A1G7MM75_9SPHI|nr:hypothetical protein [Mucilaginibacter pineti]SDF62774.1 hypothetical protein SAMN05216464_12222 [Mucilaginibacter pineti]